MKKLLFVLFLFLFFKAWSQDEGLHNYDFVYKSNIKTVQCYIDGLFTSLPIIDLRAEASIVLSFDDLDADVKNYTYTVVHCNAYWEPSNIAEMEYINGFIENRAENYQYSYSTIVPFTNYRINIPNNNIRLTKSGNYLLKVYDSENKKTLAITRRFVVTESLVRIRPQMMRPYVVNKMRTHQEIDFAVNYEGLNVRSPQQEMRATILQNGRWDNAVSDLPPLLNRIDEVVFDYQDKVSFPAGKEFRALDLRNLNFRSRGVFSIERTNHSYEVILNNDAKRAEQIYIQYVDLNGNFVVGNQNLRTSSLYEDSTATELTKLAFQGSDLSSDYANVLFILKTPEPYFDEEVYIFGALTNWQLLPDFKMQYNSALNGYVAKPMLKQGYYDYAYATVSRNAKVKTPNLSHIEGDWYETENLYTILIYYRPFGERYDRVIGAATFTSNF